MKQGHGVRRCEVKIENSTDFPNWFIRRMISWICQTDYIDWSVKKIRKVRVRNRRTLYRRISGHACPWGQSMVMSIGTLDLFRKLFEHTKLSDRVEQERIRIFVNLVAHEIGHLTQVVKTSKRGRYSEREVGWKADRVQDLFQEREGELTAAWMEPPAYTMKPKAVQPTVQEQRYARTQKNLVNWERKAKFANTKLKKYRKQLRYYEKALGINAKAAKGSCG